MKQILLSFRIFDNLEKKYLTSDSKVYIGLDGKVVTPEGPDTADRYEIAHSLPFFDTTGKQLFTDDGFVTILGRTAVYGRPIFNVDGNYWGFMAANDDVVPLKSDSFQIFPNAEEVKSGNLGSEIQEAWDKKASEIPEPEPQQNASGGFVRTREFAFGCIKVILTLHSETDMPEDVWNEHFTAVLECEDIFHVKKATEAIAEPETEEVPVKAPVVYIAQKLQHVATEVAPEELHKIPDVAAARPVHPNVIKSLRRVQGTSLVVWTITRGEHTSVASDYFVLTEKPVEGEQNTNS